MPSRSDLEIKSRLVLGLGLLSLVVVLLLRLLLPLLAIAGLGAAGFWLWRQFCKKQQHKQRQQARINAKFYQLLQQQQGRISVLDFAMRTQLDGAAAQAYLNTQAQSFSAFFETTPQGDLIYVFSSAAVRGSASQAEAVWAYSEQTYSEQARAEQARAEQIRAQEIHAQRVHAEKTQTAWNNAKQIRTLRQLAKKEQPDTRQPINRPALTSGLNPDGPVPLSQKATNKKAEKKSQSKSESKRVIQLPTAHNHASKKVSSQAQRFSSKVTLPTENFSPLIEDASQPEILRDHAYSASDFPPQKLPKRVITIDVKAVRG